MKPLAPRQTAAMREILAFEDRHGVYPTLRELMKLLGLRSTNGVHEQLVAMQRKGWLQALPYIMPTEDALTEMLGPRCAYCRRGRVTETPSRLKLAP